MPTLAKQFRVIALDLKGYGQSGKPDGDYTGSTVAAEILAMLDHIGVDTFHVAGHDWGVMVADNIINIAPNRVTRYVRCSLPFTIMTLATPFITNGMAKIPNLRHSLCEIVTLT